MAQTIQRFGSSLRCEQVAANEEPTLKVVFKIDTNLDNKSNEFRHLKNYLRDLFDEPVLFVLKERDRVAIDVVEKLGYRFVILSLDDIARLNKNNTVVLFVFSNVRKKYKKIIEILCNRVLNYSVLLI